MKLLHLLLPTNKFDLSTYRIAEGKEEYRVKREILSNLRNICGGAALDPTGERGSLRNGNNENA